MLRPRNSMFGTWFHSVGGPTQNRPYQYSCQDNKRFDSHGIRSADLLGSITVKQVAKVKAAAKRTQPQQCQKYVVALTAELERIKLVAPGWALRLSQQVQISRRALDYERQHPVSAPPGIMYSSRHNSPDRPAAAVPQPTATSQGYGPSDSRTQTTSTSARAHTTASSAHYPATSNSAQAHLSQSGNQSSRLQTSVQSQQRQDAPRRKKDEGGCCTIM